MSRFRETARYLLGLTRSLEGRRNQELVADLAAGLVELLDEHDAVEVRAAALERRVKELEQAAAEIERLVQDDVGLWRLEHEEPGPYCPACWQVERRLILLPGGPRGCPRCRQRGGPVEPQKS